MKRILLFSLILSFGLVSFAQKRGPLATKEQKQIMKTAVHNPVQISDLGGLEQPGNVTVMNTGATDADDYSVVGYTEYDFQTNAALDNRMVSFDDGTKAAVWTFGPAGTNPSFPGRGTGYVYYDGTSWSEAPTERIEDDRTGWPSVAAWGENGEIIAAHGSDGVQLGIFINRRETKGTGDWTQVILEDPDPAQQALFPRMVTSGENNEFLHVLYSYNLVAPDFNPGLYSRSNDGGDTWQIEAEMLDGMSPDDYNSIGGDNMTWAEPVGENLAFAFGDPWDTDLVIMKSDNNGDDWDKIVVWEHPYPFFDWDVTITEDTMWAPNGGHSIAIDADGKVHMVSGVCLVAHFEVGTTYNYWPYGEGVLYWNEDRDPFENDNPHEALNAWDEEIMVPDVDLIGWAQDMDGDGFFTLIEDGLFNYRVIGAETWPTIACGNNGEIAVAWSGVHETEIYNDTYHYRRIWGRVSMDNGETWSEHELYTDDITQSFDECVFPVMNKAIDGQFDILYQADYDIGTALDEDHDWAENRITHYYNNHLVGMSERPVAERYVAISQNYPNPATTTTRVNIELPVTNVNVSLEVSNMVGQILYTKDLGVVKNDEYTFVIDVEDFSAGVYFYTLKVGEESYTRKMIVE